MFLWGILNVSIEENLQLIGSHQRILFKQTTDTQLLPGRMC